MLYTTYAIQIERVKERLFGFKEIESYILLLGVFGEQDASIWSKRSNIQSKVCRRN